jgi:hypothetical protein
MTGTVLAGTACSKGGGVGHVYGACQPELAYLTSTPLQLARKAEKSGRARRMLQW